MTPQDTNPHNHDEFREPTRPGESRGADDYLSLGDLEGTLSPEKLEDIRPDFFLVALDGQLVIEREALEELLGGFDNGNL